MRNYPEREIFVGEVIKKLKNSSYSNWNRWNIKNDYRVVAISQRLNPNLLPIVLVQGWGSGWEGITPLAFSLAYEGYTIFLLSLPGYGNSENPSKDFRQNIFKNFAEVIGIFCHKSLYLGYFRKGAHFIGHSMGDQIVAKVAELYPSLARNLILINPSGFQRYGIFGRLGLIWRFMSSGVRLRLQYSKWRKVNGDYYLQQLIDICDGQKKAFGPFCWARNIQRWVEFREICKGTLSETLEKVQCPVHFIFGEEDAVFPYNPLIIPSCDEKFVESHFLPGLPHNLTLFDSEILAEKIAGILKGG